MADNPVIDQKNKKLHIAATREEVFSGPLPPPEFLQKYNQICPGAAERIITMAEKQAEHRQFLEKSVITSDVKNSRMGLWCALVITLCAIIGAVLCAFFGQPVIGSAIGLGAIGSIVTAFIYGTNSRKKEREQKAQQVQRAQ